ncbi:spore coat protein [Heyndrickxia vini]
MLMARQLAWHETLELHELMALQANCLMHLKKSVKKVTDPELNDLYVSSIRSIEKNLKELVPFVKRAPSPRMDLMRQDETGFFAGNLLGAAKTSVKSYAAAITETATPELKAIFTKHLNNSIKWHTRVFEYMHRKGLYPAYDLHKLLENDTNNVQKALSMKY